MMLPGDDVTKQRYDVIVVGAGAGGGTAAYVLSGLGFKVLMLEAGRDYDPYTGMPRMSAIPVRVEAAEGGA